jgi:hypothetical protein
MLAERRNPLIAFKQKISEGVKKLTKRLDVLKKPAPLLKARIKFLRNRDIMLKSAAIN